MPSNPRDMHVLLPVAGRVKRLVSFVRDATGKVTGIELVKNAQPEAVKLAVFRSRMRVEEPLAKLVTSSDLAKRRSEPNATPIWAIPEKATQELVKPTLASMHKRDQARFMKAMELLEEFPGLAMLAWDSIEKCATYADLLDAISVITADNVTVHRPAPRPVKNHFDYLKM